MSLDGFGSPILILKRISSNNTSFGGFKWPTEIGATVECPDWNPESTCGGGLHGWPWGLGLGQGVMWSIASDDIWLVLSAKSEDTIMYLDGTWKVKAHRATIVARGTFSECWKVIKDGRRQLIEYMRKNGMPSKPRHIGVISRTLAISESIAQTNGRNSVAISHGEDCCSISSSGHSIAVGIGKYTKVNSIGYDTKAVGVGDSSRISSVGEGSLAVAVGDGVYASGDKFSVCVGLNGLAKAGPNGVFAIGYLDASRHLNFAVGQVGVNGIKAGVAYCVRDYVLQEV